MPSELADKNIFMVCHKLNPSALSDLPHGYQVRLCRKDELNLWMQLPFDSATEAKTYQEFMNDFFQQVYAPKGDLFFQRCLFICDRHDIPVGTVFLWRAYDAFNSIHWLKVRQDKENKGLGRALLSVLLRDLNEKEYPLYLHTQLGSYRAIHLYATFGFALITNEQIGPRKNDLDECLPYLQEYLGEKRFAQLKMVSAPETFLQQMAQVETNEF